MKLPYKIELRNCYELIKECFGIEEHKRQNVTKHKRGIAELEEIIIHLAPKREKREREKKEKIKREEQIRQTQNIKKIDCEHLDIPVNKYLMIDASTNTDDLENVVLSSLPPDNSDYVYL